MGGRPSGAQFRASHRSCKRDPLWGLMPPGKALVAVQAGLGLLAGPIPQHFSKASFPRESNLGKVCLPRLYQDSSGGFQLNWNPKPRPSRPLPTLSRVAGTPNIPASQKHLGRLEQWVVPLENGLVKASKACTSVQEQGVAPNRWRKATPIYFRDYVYISGWRNVNTLNPRVESPPRGPATTGQKSAILNHF